MKINIRSVEVNTTLPRFHLYIYHYPYIMLTKQSNKVMLILNTFIITIFTLSHLVFTPSFIGYMLLFLQLSLHNIFMTINPGTPAINSVALNKCVHCNYPKINGTEHCFECNICIEQHDHHCNFIGRCLGKRNKKLFMVFAGVTGILWWYIVINVIRSYVAN